MKEIIGYFIFLLIQIFLISASFWIIKKKLTEQIFARVILTLLIWCGLNSFASNITFYIFGKFYYLEQLLLIYGIEIAGLVIIIIKHKQPRIINLVCFEFDKITKIIFLIVFSGLFLFLFFNSSELMPYWGNVDEAVHFEMCNTMYQRMFFSLTNKNIVTDMYAGRDFVYWDTRYTYIFGYHYICSVIAKISNIDLIYITHIVRCFMLSLFVSVPLLFIRGRYKLIIATTYIWLMLSSVYLWFGAIITLGYSAQLYSMALAFAVIVLFENEIKTYKTEQNRFWSWVIVPFLCLLILNAYMLTGLFVILYACLRGFLNKNYIQSLLIFTSGLFEIIHPYVLKQITVFISGVGKMDQAISVGSSLRHPINSIVSVLCICAIIYFIINIISKQTLFSFKGTFMALISVAYLSIYYLHDNLSYIMFKTWVMFVPILMISIPLILNNLLECFPKKFVILKGIFVSIACISFVVIMSENGIIHKDIKKEIAIIRDSIPSLTRDEYICTKYISSNLANESNIEYLGMNGPSIAYSRVLISDFPYSNILFNSPADFMFRTDGSFKTLFEAADKFISLGEYSGDIVLLIDHSKIKDEEVFVSNTDYFSEITSIFSSGSCEVLKVKVNSEKNLEKDTER